MASETTIDLRRSVLWYYSRGYNRQKILDLIRANPRFNRLRLNTIGAAYQYVVDMSRSAGYLKNSNADKQLAKINIVGNQTKSALIRASISATYDFPASSTSRPKGKQRVSFTFDFDNTLTVVEMQQQLRNKLADFFDSKYNLRTNRRRITNISVDYLERV